MSALCLLLFGFSTYVTNSKDWNTEFAHYRLLDESQQFKLYWTILNDDYIDIGLEMIDNRGWISIGISPNGKMSESDIIIGWIDDQQTYLQNRYTSKSMETPIFAENIKNTLIMSHLNDKIMQIRFTRKLFPCRTNNTNKDHNIRHIEIGTTSIIYAWSDKNPDCSHSKHCIPSYHNQHSGSSLINFFSGDIPEVQMPLDVLYHDFIANNYTIPPKKNIQYTFRSSFPNLPVLHHIIRVDPLIQSRHENVVIHHIVVSNYASILYEWSPGRGKFYFPSHIGLEVGGTDKDKLQYVSVNIHYTNYDKQSGIIDNSGLRFYYTPTLRNNSAMIMSVGYRPHNTIMIPGNMDDVTINGYCSSEGTLNAFPKNGINIISNAFHMHTAGIYAKLRHIRGDTELKPIDINNKFDMDHQEFVLFKKERNVLPGDELIVECHYSTQGKVNTVQGGNTASNEMCHNWMIVYPKTALIRCTSHQPQELLNKFFINAKKKGYWNGINYNISKPNASEYYKQFFNSINQPIRTAYNLPTYSNKFQGQFDTPESQNGFKRYTGNYFGKKNNYCRNKNEKNDINKNKYMKTWIIVFVATNMGIVVVLIGISYICKKECIQTTDHKTKLKTTEEIIPFIDSNTIRDHESPSI